MRDLLRDPRHAVHGTMPRLVANYRAGVKWNPADECCVAGELLAAQPSGTDWALRGEISSSSADESRALAGNRVT